MARGKLLFRPEPSIPGQVASLIKATLFLLLQVTVLLPIYLAVAGFLALMNIAQRLYERIYNLGLIKVPKLEPRRRIATPIEQPKDEINILITGVRRDEGVMNSIAREYIERARQHKDQQLNLFIVGQKDALDLGSIPHNAHISIKSKLDMTDKNSVRKFIEDIHKDESSRLDVAIIGTLHDKVHDSERLPLEERDLAGIKDCFNATVNFIYPVLDVFRSDLKNSPRSWKQLAIVSSMSTNYSPTGDSESIGRLAARELARSLRYRLQRENVNIGISVVMPPANGSNTIRRELSKFFPFVSTVPAESKIVDGIHRNLEIVTPSTWMYTITRVFQFLPPEFAAAVHDFATRNPRDVLDNIGMIASHLRQSSPVKILTTNRNQNGDAFGRHEEKDKGKSKGKISSR